jgi:hypothetical protein
MSLSIYFPINLALPISFVKYLPKTWTVYGNEPLELSCQLSKPNVKVTWLKDGLPIDNKGQMKNDGLRYSLHIPHGVEPGRYTIKIDDQESSCQVSTEGIRFVDKAKRLENDFLFIRSN